MACPWPESGLSRAQFADTVWRQGAAHYRDLPWRNVDDPYAVLVSEVMLQQTQVKRVLQYWPRWMRSFPTVDALAAASVEDVLSAWQGLGYNRRGLALKRLADECAAGRGGCLPETADELQKLPGVGPATAGGVVAFAYNRPAVYIETNVRSVFLHCMFPQEEGVTDKQLVPLVKDVCPQDNPRAWYYALLDFGAWLKSQGVNPSRRSAHYAKQSAFEGSRRQKRAFILRAVLDDPGIAADAVLAQLNAAEFAAGRGEVDPQLFASVVNDLVREGFFARTDNCLG
ncbi:MAG: adenine glycosylase [Coriobacteriia bacterium]|nr:adenine glycosylase [Coriobacteriia bacterium]